MPDRIRIEGIEFHGYHGVTPEERVVGHRFRVEVTLDLDLREAGRTDEVARTVNYAEAARSVVEEGTGPSACLVETVAERMAARLLRDHPMVEAVEVALTKLQPPAPIPFQNAVILIRRTRPA